MHEAERDFVFSQVLRLVLGLAMLWQRETRPDVVRERMDEVLAILKARADHGGIKPRIQFVRDFLWSHCWSTIWRRIQLEYVPNHVPDGLSAEVIEQSLESHWNDFVQNRIEEERRKLSPNPEKTVV
jgi:hypothetical protein